MIYLVPTILILLSGIIFNVNKKDAKCKKIYLIVSFGIMIIISSLRKYTVGIDMKLIYYPSFLEISKISFANLGNVQLEQLYVLLCKILSILYNNIQILIIVSSVFVLTVYAFFIYKNSKNIVISTSLFLLLNIFFMTMNIVRQEIAVAIILIAFEYIKRGKNITATIIIIIASFFHQSAIICLLFMPLYKAKFTKKSVMYGIVILIIGLLCYKPIINGITYIMNLLGLNANKNYSEYLSSKTYGTGIFNLDTLSNYIVSGAIFMVCYYYIIYLCPKHKNEDFSNFLTYMSMVYFIISLISSKMIIIARLEYYFLPFILISIPEALSYSKKSQNRTSIITILYLALFSKYLYILFNLADILYGVVPYTFFWN